MKMVKQAGLRIDRKNRAILFERNGQTFARYKGIDHIHFNSIFELWQAYPNLRDGQKVSLDPSAFENAARFYPFSSQPTTQQLDNFQRTFGPIEGNVNITSGAGIWPILTKLILAVITIGVVAVIVTVAFDSMIATIRKPAKTDIQELPNGLFVITTPDGHVWITDENGNVVDEDEGAVETLVPVIWGVLAILLLVAIAWAVSKTGMLAKTKKTKAKKEAKKTVTKKEAKKAEPKKKQAPPPPPPPPGSK